MVRAARDNWIIRKAHIMRFIASPVAIKFEPGTLMCHVIPRVTCLSRNLSRAGLA